MSDRPCYECIWYSVDEGCTTWDCKPVSRKEARERLNIVKCGNCKHWQTPIAYEAVGKCKLHDRITNKNYYCGDGKEKE